ncbi:hypothetical protein HOY34_07800 [Xinfangfangia sp. D13-10-4-6]|uniref:hypothetical protein n=1 Tax=Pseudogemmobacter hezensis TaxID=2737662 RepID=UPI0015562A30|nr:hypothetical protein [Pseudogemmobacter hezensis]NPD15104.1 hypothetical protein [Pseudogemmobacter hezensis]
MDVSGTVLPVTAKQVAYAQKLALRNQVILPWDAQQDRQSLSRWIETQAAVRPAERFNHPSSKQVAFAERLARIKRKTVPNACFRDREMMSRWLDSNR